MSRFSAVATLALGGAFLLPGPVRAQFRGGPDWMTAGGDAQRSSWIRSDPKISVERMEKPGFALVWKIRLAHEPGPATTLSRYIGYRGFRSLALMGSASGDLTAIDTDLGRLEWKKSLPAGTADSPSANCPGGMTAEVTRATTAALPGAPAGRGGGMFPGRSGPAKSAVGEPGEGAVIIREIAAREATLASAGRGPNGGRGGANAGRGGFPPGFRRMPSYLDVLSSDGMLHRMYVSNGDEPEPPIPFLDRSANVHGLIVIDNMAYAATSGGCGGVPNAIWALDLTSKQTAHWTADGDIAGDEGPSFGPDGTLYAATTTGALVALEPKTLQVKATYHSGGQPFITSPVVFEDGTKTMIAAATADNRLHLVDAHSLSGAAYEASVSGALASWQDAAGARWFASPAKDSIKAWKLADQGGTPVLQPGWTSRSMAAPLAPVVINGVLFAVSNSPAPMLYAFDAGTGKDLWNSGNIITKPVGNSRLTGSDSQLYLGTTDGTIYSFGFPIEH
jgi:outer membrane protein assembly factor BamB